jgi:hypothetical protein
VCAFAWGAVVTFFLFGVHEVFDGERGVIVQVGGRERRERG